MRGESLQVSTMDNLAYGGTFDDVLAAASAGKNILDGAENGHLAPYGVRRNQQALREREWSIEHGLEAEVPEMKPRVNRDVLAEHDPMARARGEGRKSPVATAVRARRPRPAYAPYEGEPAKEVDDFQL